MSDRVSDEAIDAAMERYQRNGFFAQRAPMTLAISAAARFIRAPLEARIEELENKIIELQKYGPEDES